MTVENFKEEVLVSKDKYYRFAYSITGNRELAEDIVQEVLMKVWDSRNSIQSINNKEAWCMRLVRNLSIDKLRVKANQNEGLDRAWGTEDNSPNPHDITATNEIHRIIGKMIEELPDSQRDVVQLRDVSGYSYLEISEMLSMDMNLVKVTLFRARKKLREQLRTINIYG